MTIKINFSSTQNKKDCLELLKKNLEEMHAANEDALIDSLTGAENELTLVLQNFNKEKYSTLIVCFEIIQKENSKITIIYE